MTAGDLSVRVRGTTGTPVVLLHGLVGSSIYWGGHYDCLAESHRLLVPDLLGFGRSAKPKQGYGADDHARAVISCLDAMGVREPAVLGAHSAGTIIALRVAASHPARVKAVVAFAPVMYADERVARRLARRTGAMARLFVGSPFAHAMCRWVCRHNAVATKLAMWSHPLLPARIAADAVSHTWASYSETLQRVILAAEAHHWLDHVQAPVRLVAGRSDRSLDPPFLAILASRHANLDFEAWPGRHDLPLADPRRCAALIERAASGSASLTADLNEENS